MIDFDKRGLQDYITDPEVESEIGVWLKFPGNREILVLRAGGANRAFGRAFQAAIKPYRKQLDRGTLDPETGDAIMRQVYAKHVVRDWKGVCDAHGNEIPYSEEAGVAFFKAFPELFNEIVAIAGDLNTFALETLEEAKVTLGEASDGA